MMMDDDGRVDIQYRDVAIKVTAAGYTAFFQTKERFIEEVVDNIDDRFPANSMTVLDTLGILNPKRCPANPAFYGNQELQVLLDHYGKERNGRNVQSLLLLMNKQLGLNGDNCAS